MSIFIAISDVAQNHADISKHDISGTQTLQWTEELAEYFNVSIRQSPDIIGSTFGNSIETGVQAICLLEKIAKGTKPQVLLVNNATRGDYEEKQNAKASDCLFAKIKTSSGEHYVTGVDNTVFGILQCYYGENFSSLALIKGVKQHPDYKDFLGVADLSSGTQFRSKEHFPLVQVLLTKILQKNGNINFNLLNEWFFYDSEYSISFNLDDIKSKLIDMLDCDNTSTLSSKDLFQKYIAYMMTHSELIIQNGGTMPHYNKEYIEPQLKGIELVKILGDREYIKSKLGIATQGKYCHLLDGKEDLIKTYYKLVNSLKDNQALVIDIDKFENVVLATSKNISGIEDFCKKNELILGDNIQSGSLVMAQLKTGEEINTFECKKGIGNSKLGSHNLWSSSSNFPGERKGLNIGILKQSFKDSFEEVGFFKIGAIIEFTKIK